MSNSLWPQGLQHARLPCSSLSPEVCSYSCPLSRWCYLPISSILCHPFLLLPSIFPSIRVFSNESSLRIRWPKYWSFSFSINLFNEYSRLISFRIDWFDLAVQVTFKGHLQHHNSKVSTLQHSAFFMVPLSWITALSWRRGLHNSVKLWAMWCRAPQDGRVIVESSDKMWPTGRGNGKPLQYSCYENSMNSMKNSPVWYMIKIHD